MNMHTITICCLMIFFGSMQAVQSHAQSGCTDSQADNYDENALHNDGSCLYPATNYQATLSTNLATDLNEISGLAFVNSRLWAHNDGGNSPSIFRIDSTQMSFETATNFTQINNVDWEDAAQSNTHLFLGDFGNNMGNRTDLRIYQLALNDLDNPAATAVVISFTYEDQTDFTPSQNNNNFDCEAFFFHNDSLHLFTKNWTDLQTKHYVLPAQSGQHIAQLRNTFDTQGLITGADIAADGKIVLTGYTNLGLAFMWLLFDYPEQRYFDGNKRRIELGTALTNGQLESIVFSHPKGGFLAGESFLNFPPRLLRFDIGEWTDTLSSIHPVNYTKTIPIQVYPNPASSKLDFQVPSHIQHTVTIEVYSTMGQQLYSEVQAVLRSNNTVDIAFLPKGMYYLHIHSSGSTYSSVFQKH